MDDYRYPQAPDDPVARFWTWVDVSKGPHACWDWTGSCNDRGEAVFHPKHNRTTTARRYSYFVSVGAPGRQFVTNICGNLKCVNPAHLELVRSRRQRSRRGV